MKRLFGIALLALLASCGGDHLDDLKKFVQESGQGLRGKVDPLPQVKPYAQFVYQAYDLPDPFKPRKLKAGESSGKGLQPDLNRPKELLEGYPLENLKMVGSLAQNKVMHAIIKAPDKAVYRVKVGNYMGQNFGFVTAITESEVKLKEIVQDGTGEWTERESTLQLQE